MKTINKLLESVRPNWTSQITGSDVEYVAEEYSKQESIEFGKWTYESGYHWLPEYGIWVNSELHPGVEWNDDQLYKIWKDEKSK